MTKNRLAKKARMSVTADTRPVCKHGTKCYRQNPAHFVEFAHPWLDEENRELETLPGILGPECDILEGRSRPRDSAIVAGAPTDADGKASAPSRPPGVLSMLLASST